MSSPVPPARPYQARQTQDPHNHSGELGPLEPPFSDVTDSLALDSAREVIGNERQQIAARISELEDGVAMSQKKLLERQERRRIAAHVLEEIERDINHKQRSQITEAWQEYADAEVAYNALRSECDHFDRQLDVLKIALEQLEVAWRLSEALQRERRQLPDRTLGKAPAHTGDFTTMLAVREYERQVLAQTIDERITSRLTQALQRVQMAGSGVLQIDRVRYIEDILADIHHYLREALHEATVLKTELEPEIGNLGLAAALQLYVQRLVAARGPAIVARIEPIQLRAHMAAERAIFRVACETITNAMSHANSRNIYVCLREHQRLLILTVEDDGIGFDVSEVMARNANNQQCGLGRLCLEADLIGASLGIASTPGRGTRIDYVVTVPSAALTS